MERVDTLDVVLLALAIALVPPVLLWLVGAAGGLAGGAGVGSGTSPWSAACWPPWPCRSASS
jgi:hypothetical protein